MKALKYDLITNTKTLIAGCNLVLYCAEPQ